MKGKSGPYSPVGRRPSTGKARVGIVMGSASDLEIMRETSRVLDEFGIDHVMEVASAHRAPKRTARFAREAGRRGLEVIIAGAGGAAHLPGVIAAETTLPVIGVPIGSSSLGGFDALLSIAQMPGGVPVAAMAIGKAGARNAGLLAVQILALGDPAMRERLRRYKTKLEIDVARSAKRIHEGH